MTFFLIIPLVLGGGGYNFPNTAKLWLKAVALVAGIDLSKELPNDFEFFDVFAPSFEI